MIKNYHLIEVKYLGATDRLGTRVSLYSPITKERVIIPYDYSTDYIIDMAAKYLEDKGFEIVGFAEAKNEDILILKEFGSIKWAG